MTIRASTSHSTPRRGGLLAALVLGGGLCATNSAQAVLIIDLDPGTLFTTSGLSGFQTSGADMAGMQVTALFDDDTMELATWAATVGDSGQAAGTGWSLSQSGDTFSNPWTLTNATGRGMLGLIIDGPPGDTVFDLSQPSQGTAGSANGFTFSVQSGPADLDITATYRNLVAIDEATPVGDLYGQLELAFTSLGGFGGGEDLNYRADTDSAALQGDIRPAPPAAVPEPVSLGLFGLGLLGAACARRRRR